MPQNNEDFLRGLIEKYARLYMKMANMRGIPYDDVEDVVMDAFAAFHRSGKDRMLCGDENGARLLLGRIVVNKCTDYYRKHSRMDVVALEDHETEAETGAGPAGRRGIVDPERAVVSRENLRRIQECIYRMKETWSEPARLYFIEERSIGEISDALGISRTVCRARISRARKHLRKELEDLLKD